MLAFADEISTIEKWIEFEDTGISAFKKLQNLGVMVILGENDKEVGNQMAIRIYSLINE